MENLSESQQAIKELLDVKAEEFNANSFIESDPIQIPHHFQHPKDVEVIALLMATIAWGNRTMIIRNGHELMKIMGDSPHDFILNYKPEYLNDKSFVHRTFNLIDLDFFFRGLKGIYKKYDSLENAFYPNQEMLGVGGRIISFRNEFFKTKHEQRSEKHISNPLKTLPPSV